MANLALVYSVILAHVFHPFYHQYLALNSTDMEKKEGRLSEICFSFFFYKTNVLTEYPFRCIFAVANR